MTAPKMRIAWLCGLPKDVQHQAFPDAGLGPTPDWSWIVGHLPPPPNIELHIVSPSRRVSRVLQAQCAGTHFHILPVQPGGVHSFYWNWIVKYQRFLQELRPDCVHGWGTEAGFGIAAIKSGCPYVVGIQGLLAEYWPFLPHRLTLRLAIWNERRTLRAARCVVAEGDYSQQAAAQYTPAKIRVISHPLRQAFVSAQPGARDSRTILFLGSPQKRKGFPDALQAFAQLPFKDWNLVCIGDLAAHDRPEVVNLLDRLGIADRVQFVGTCSAAEVVRWLERSPILLLPSYIDTGPTALKEALAMGVWPVCYGNSGPKELVTRYQFGNLATTGDIADLALNLRQAITEKPWRDAERVERCAAAIRHDLDRDRIWQQLTRLYEERLHQAEHSD